MVTGVPRCYAAEMRGGPVGSGSPSEIRKAGTGDSSQETDLDNSQGEGLCLVGTNGLKRAASCPCEARCGPGGAAARPAAASQWTALRRQFFDSFLKFF